VGCSPPSAQNAATFEELATSTATAAASAAFLGDSAGDCCTGLDGVGFDIEPFVGLIVGTYDTSMASAARFVGTEPLSHVLCKKISSINFTWSESLLKGYIKTHIEPCL
jgi:hypothetical protein